MQQCNGNTRWVKLVDTKRARAGVNSVIRNKIANSSTQRNGATYYRQRTLFYQLTEDLTEMELSAIRDELKREGGTARIKHTPAEYFNGKLRREARLYVYDCEIAEEAVRVT